MAPRPPCYVQPVVGDVRDNAATGEARYLALSERAVALAATRTDGVTDGELVCALFGPVAGDQWGRLLLTVLAPEARLTRRGDRWFTTIGRHDGPPQPGNHLSSTVGRVGTSCARQVPPHAEPTITTLALATTGADPRRHRIARIAAVRRANGKTLDCFDAVVQPDRRLSRFVLDAARVVEEDLDNAPLFAEVVRELAEFLGNRGVHVYGAGRAQAFLVAECRRAEITSLNVQLLEIDELLGSVLEPGRKPGLRSAARDLGVPVPTRASPLADADLAARVVERVRQRQAASPPRSALGAEPSGTKAAPDHALSGSTNAPPVPFTRAWAANAPEGPGVYIFEDAEGQALYIGKAVALRRRLAAYVQRQPALHRQMEALGVRAARMATIETPSDLEATLLEARLIRERAPAFNVARQTRLPSVIVRASADAASPRVQLTHTIAADGARYFGPFESVHAAQDVVRTARAVYPDAFQRRRGDVARQRVAVLDVCQLLSGQRGPARDSLKAAMRAAAAAGDLADVERLRGALRAVQTLDIRPSILAGLAEGWRLCVVEQVADSRRRGHLLHDGLLVGSTDLGPRSVVSGDGEVTGGSADDDDGAGKAGPRWRHDGHSTTGSCACGSVPGGWDAAAAAPGRAPIPDPTHAASAHAATERAIVLRWLTQARGRITVHRLPSAPAGREPTSRHQT